MGTALALAAALTYGAADFTGGYASRRSPTLAVVVLSQLGGGLLLALLLPALPATSPTVGDFAWGGIAGVAGAAGIAFLYHGLAIGRMSVVAPITALMAAMLPVLFGLLTGEEPSALALVGVFTALGAVVLISLVPGDGGRVPLRALLAQAELPIALAAGTGFGTFFILLERVGAQAGLWPLLAARGVSVPLLAAVGIALGYGLRPAQGSIPLIAFAGALDMAANVFYLLATRSGLLSLVAVLTSLYPASTVLLARLVLGERLVRTQLAGLACAGVGVVLIAGG